MNRYKPTAEEIAALAALVARGWRHDNDGWWWPADECGYGRTYREAMKESARREQQSRRNGEQNEL